jgi:hypothetical protein
MRSAAPYPVPYVVESVSEWVFLLIMALHIDYPSKLLESDLVNGTRQEPELLVSVVGPEGDRLRRAILSCQSDNCSQLATIPDMHINMHLLPLDEGLLTGKQAAVYAEHGDRDVEQRITSEGGLHITAKVVIAASADNALR